MPHSLLDAKVKSERTHIKFYAAFCIKEYIVESQIEIYNTLVDEQVLGWPQEFRFDIIINILNKIEKTGGHPLFYAD